MSWGLWALPVHAGERGRKAEQCRGAVVKKQTPLEGPKDPSLPSTALTLSRVQCERDFSTWEGCLRAHDKVAASRVGP